MIQLHKVFLALLALNALFLIVFYSRSSGSTDSRPFNLETSQNLLTKEPTQTDEEKQSKKNKIDVEIAQSQTQLNQIKEALSEAKYELENVQSMIDIHTKDNKVAASTPSKASNVKVPFKPFVNATPPFATFSRAENPFYRLGAYPKIQIEVPYENRFEDYNYTKRVLYGYFNDEDYCERVDYYNLAHPENIFVDKVFFTDYQRNTVPRQDVIPSIGRNTIAHFQKHLLKKEKRRLFHFDIDINTFFINADGFQTYHEIGKHFLCATQMFNHIPGQRALVRKDDLVEAIHQYAQKFANKPKCFNKKMFFPYSYRLYREDECKEFFEHINSESYKQSLQKEPVQFIMKIGHGSHSSLGVDLLDQKMTKKVNEDYDFGNKCGDITTPLVGQVYVANPLLLDRNNKFDFRVYMLVASTNPLIVYYHDGFLRASLSSYEKKSTERGKHLTNTHLAEDIFKLARKNGTYDGMTEEELREYHIWSFQELEDYLVEEGLVGNETSWLESHLRPQFRKAMIHILKMTSGFFLKQSNVYGLFGLDFMLDDEFNLWFIEANPNPQLMATSDFLGDLLENLLRSLFDIEYGLYKSRMSRVLKIVQKMQADDQKGVKSNMDDYRQEYKLATLNRFEKEYEPKRKGTFTMIMNEYLEGPKAYFGNLDEECILPRN